MRKVIMTAALAVVTLTGCSLLPGSKQYDAFEDGPGRLMQSDDIENATPKDEPFSELGNKSPYSVNGRFYYVMEDPTHYRARGKASWYGNKFHGRKTSSGEPFDMYAMTAAHRNLPLPTYLEVTNLDNGKAAIVKVNDRGPFVDDRLIDLSYAAAVKLGMMEKGTAPVEVRAVTGTQIADAKRQTKRDSKAARVQASAQQPSMPVKKVKSTLEVGSVEGAAQEVDDNMVMTSEQVAVASSSVKTKKVETTVAVAAEVATQASQSAESETPLAIQLGAFSVFEGAKTTMEKAQALLPAIPAFVTKGLSNGQPIYRVRVGPVNTKQLIDDAKAALARGGMTGGRVLPMAGGGDCVAGCR